MPVDKIPAGGYPDKCTVELLRSAENALQGARLRIFNRMPFTTFSGATALGRSIVTASVPFPASTDGWNTWWNPFHVQAFKAAGLPYLQGLVLHIAMHKAYGHGGKGTWLKALSTRYPMELVHKAEDLFINTMLRQLDPEEKFIQFPNWAVQPNMEYKGLAVAQILRIWTRNEKPVPSGDPMDGHDWSGHDLRESDLNNLNIPPNALELIKREMMTATTRAKLLNAGRGSMPGGDVMQSLIGKLTKPRLSYKDKIRSWIRMTAIPGSGHASWTRVNRRYLAQGIYMPGSVRLEGGVLALLFDCSGSDWDQVPYFLAELQGLIRECNPKEVHVLFVDTKVQEHVVLKGQTLMEVDKLRPKGNGGTILTVAFDYLKDQGIKPDGLIGFTDGDTPWPHKSDVKFPTLWVITNPVTQAPLGTTIHLDLSQL